MTRLVFNDEVEQHFPMSACLSSLETMFEEMAADRAITSSREDMLAPVEDPPEGSEEPVYYGLKGMGGVIPELDVGAIRINSDIIHWPKKDGERVRDKIPAADGRYTGLVWLFDSNTGEPLMICPDGMIQSYRVGATSALGAKYLSRPDSTRLGMLGAGFQARAHLLALNEVRDLETVHVYSPTPASRREFADEMEPLVEPSVTPVDAPQKVFENSDIVQSTTNATSPVFELEWIEPGTHVGIIRNYEAPDEFFDPDRFDAFVQSWSKITQLEELGNQLNEREIPTKNVNNYVVEGDQPVPKFESGTPDPLCDWERVDSLADVIAGSVAGRSDPDGITAMFNEGMGIQFAAAGKALYEIAEQEDLGTIIPTESLTQEYHP